MNVKALVAVFKQAAMDFYDKDTFTQGAALAYYTVFSLAPVLVIAIGIGGLVFDKEAARREIMNQIEGVAGHNVQVAVTQTMQQASDKGSGVLATLVGIVVLIFAATTVFVQVQTALNTIWGVQPKPGRGLWGLVQDRLLSFSIVLVIGFLLLVSLVISAILSGLSKISVALPGSVYLWEVVNGIVSFAFITLLFAMIYKILPDVIIAWRDVWIGAAVTALLFTGGKYLIGLYLGQSNIASSFGAAGSVVLILVWVYYSSQVFLFGAEFTQAHAQASGKPLVPAPNAQLIPPTAPEQSAPAPGQRPTPKAETGLPS